MAGGSLALVEMDSTMIIICVFIWKVVCYGCEISFFLYGRKFVIGASFGSMV